MWYQYMQDSYSGLEFLHYLLILLLCLSMLVCCCVLTGGVGSLSTGLSCHYILAGVLCSELPVSYQFIIYQLQSLKNNWNCITNTGMIIPVRGHTVQAALVGVLFFRSGNMLFSITSLLGILHTIFLALDFRFL